MEKSQLLNDYLGEMGEMIDEEFRDKIVEEYGWKFPDCRCREWKEFLGVRKRSLWWIFCNQN
jgi:hypothetical protein